MPRLVIIENGVKRWFKEKQCKYCRGQHFQKNYDTCGSCQWFYKEGPHYENEQERLQQKGYI